MLVIVIVMVIAIVIVIVVIKTLVLICRTNASVHEQRQMFAIIKSVYCGCRDSTVVATLKFFFSVLAKCYEIFTIQSGLKCLLL